MCFNYFLGKIIKHKFLPHSHIVNLERHIEKRIFGYKSKQPVWSLVISQNAYYLILKLSGAETFIRNPDRSLSVLRPPRAESKRYDNTEVTFFSLFHVP